MSDINSTVDYRRLGLRVGLEIHQQLNTGKLFCSCPSELTDEKFTEFTRYLRPTQSEMGEIDRAALAEAQKNLRFRYQAPGTTCLVEADEEPPHSANSEAVDTVLQIACMLGADVVDEIQFMRKIVIDGSNTTGFQRTALISLGGEIDTGDRKINITTLCLEEDAARKVEMKSKEVTYRLDRLGIPLIEIATAPEIYTPEDVRKTAESIGALLRATGKAKRGIGTIREDLNISIKGGARVEIKGVQELNKLPLYVMNEVKRQVFLIDLKGELIKRDKDEERKTADKILSAKDEMRDVTHIFENTDSKVISNALNRKGKVIAVRLPFFSGLLRKKSATTEFGFGAELAQYAKKTGVRGIFHSDELPGYGITENDVKRIAGTLELEDTDAFVLVAEREEIARNSLISVIERSAIAAERVPEETRDPFPDGTTAYSRPLPGGARMYPETDVPPVHISEEKIYRIKENLPEMPREKFKRLMEEYNLPEEQVRQLIGEGLDVDFEAMVNAHGKSMGSIIARTLLNIIPEMKSEGADTERITVKILNDVLAALDEGKFAKEGIPNVLRWFAENPEGSVEEACSSLGFSAMDEEHLGNTIQRIISERQDFVRERGMNSVGPLMGVVMGKVRGKIDGKKVNAVLRREIKEFLKKG